MNPHLEKCRLAALAVRTFNEKHPAGTPVRYISDFADPRPRVTKTRSSAQILASGHAVVWVEGVAGCVALSHVEVVVQ